MARLLVGSRITYEGGLPSLVGKAGVITRFNVSRTDRDQCAVSFFHDGRERVVNIKNLVPYGVNTMKNIKSTVLTAVQALLKPLDADSAKEQAVRRLGVGSELVRLGEADKKKAKAELTTLGIITGGEQNGVVFDSPRYVVTATTKAASTGLDATALRSALEAEKLSGAAITRILSGATVTRKAATSFAVETK